MKPAEYIGKDVVVIGSTGEPALAKVIGYERSNDTYDVAVYLNKAVQVKVTDQGREKVMNLVPVEYMEGFRAYPYLEPGREEAKQFIPVGDDYQPLIDIAEKIRARARGEGEAAATGQDGVEVNQETNERAASNQPAEQVGRVFDPRDKNKDRVISPEERQAAKQEGRRKPDNG